jgi:hypothetical protein
MMSDRHEFTISMLQLFAKMGLDTSESRQAVRLLREQVKTAAEDFRKDADLGTTMAAGAGAAKLGRGVVDFGRSLVDLGATGLNHLGTAGKWGLGLGLGIPAVAGVAGGVGLAKATDIDDDDIEAAKIQELVNEYREQAERLRRNRRVYRLPRG